MKRRAVAGLVGLAVAAGLANGCWFGSADRKPGAQGQKAPSGQAALRTIAAEKPGAAGEIQALTVNYREMAQLCAREKPPFPAIASKAWEMAAEADALLRLVETAAPAAPAAPAKSTAPDPVVADLDLISIDAKRLALAAATWDEPEVRTNWAKLRLPCQRLFGPPETPPSAAAAPATTPQSAPPPAGKK